MPESLRPGRRLPWFAVFVLAVAIWLFLAADQQLHWDEPGYLYAAVYLDAGSILTGDFQPSGIPMFTVSRSLHILLLQGILSLTGPGQFGILVVQLVYLAMLAATLLLTAGVVRELLPEHSRDLPLAIGLVACSPIIFWLGFKTMPETPALLLATATCHALLKAAKPGGNVGWIIMAGACAALTAFFKNLIVLMPVALVISILVCGAIGIARSKLFSVSALAGMLSLGLFFILLTSLGIPLVDYLAVSQSVMLEPASWTVKAYFALLEGGALFASILIASLARDRRGFRLFLTWFLLSTLPVLALPDIEERYLVPNIAAMAGLTVLAVAAIRRFIDLSRPRAAMIVAMMLAIVALPSVLVQRIMSHEVAMDELSDMIETLDGQIGSDEFTIASPWEFSTFLYLRVAYPDRSVVSVHQSPGWKFPVWTAEEQRQFFGPRFVEDPLQLERYPAPFVYLGFEYNLAVSNLRSWVEHIPHTGIRDAGLKMITSKVDETQLQTSWLWHAGKIRKRDIKIGNYEAYILPEISG